MVYSNVQFFLPSRMILYSAVDLYGVSDVRHDTVAQQTFMVFLTAGMIL